ncbi:tetratricopeptide repeat protein [Streptomyces olivaceoviridis]|uniref:tetratricopeptide repeat protein n=1 Tax=Streptomyces olivaceoviridis TaxID=1921 RepID=UPI0036812B40
MAERRWLWTARATSSEPVDAAAAPTGTDDSRPASDGGGAQHSPPHKIVVGREAIGAGGNIEGSALAPGSRVTNIHEQHIHQPPAGDIEVAWPVEVGPVPALASAFQPRSALRQAVDDARSHGAGVVLTQVLSGGGGVGKTQLAAACAIDALQDGVDLVVWAAATETQQLITQYAQAAARIRLPGATGQDPQSDARTLLEWLATTPRRWLVVLDDITDSDAVSRWWPVSRTGTGWVLATTRLKDARLTGGGRTRVDIDVYTPEEADSYLRARLIREKMSHLLDDQAPALADALGLLPLALSHAAAYMINEELGCTAYLNLFTHRQTRLNQALPETADTEGYGRQVTATLLISLAAAQTADPTGFTFPALHLAALFDPAGHPHDLWATPSLLNYLTNHPQPDTPLPTATHATPAQAHTVLRLLHRYALITCDLRAEPRAVRMHALTARAVRETVPEDRRSELAVAAADALLELWPEIDQPHPDLAATLRANTDALAAHAGNLLWHPDAHTVLFRAGTSLFHAGLAASGAAYWQHMMASSERLLGGEHPDTLRARANLAASYRQAGRTGEAIAIDERVVADSERLLGGEHPDTLRRRANLAGSYWQAGRTGEAIAIEERVVADRERLLGGEHPDTLTTRSNLAASYRQAGRTGESIELLERVVDDSERLLGGEHPYTLTFRSNLAASYRQAGRTGEAIELLERVVADFHRLLGGEHPSTLTARANLGGSYYQAGRTGEAIELLERVVADSERVLGDEHPDSLSTRANLAASYRQAGRTGEAIDLLERVVADFERVLGGEHPSTLSARFNLADSYCQAGRMGEAIAIEERVVADSERVLGGEHPDTLASRSYLAGLYFQAGRTGEAIELLEQVVADSGRLLGGEHPDTLIARANLAASYRQAGRTGEAIELLERVVADSERVLGGEHPDTLGLRAALSEWRTLER